MRVRELSVGWICGMFACRTEFLSSPGEICDVRIVPGVERAVNSIRKSLRHSVVVCLVVVMDTISNDLCSSNKTFLAAVAGAF